MQARDRARSARSGTGLSGQLHLRVPDVAEIVVGRGRVGERDQLQGHPDPEYQ